MVSFLIRNCRFRGRGEMRRKESFFRDYIDTFHRRF